ncbi:unnamed protein product, partial [Polarella glacialis]
DGKMSASPIKAQPVLIFYYIPADGDEAEAPNAFPILKADGRVLLQDVRSKFPLPGTYHFRFRMRYGIEPSQVTWMDVTDPTSQVPSCDGKVLAKVSRVSWDSAASPLQAAAASAAPAAAAQRPQPPPPA